VNLEQMRMRFGMATTARRPHWNIEQGGGTASLHLYGAIGGYWGDIDAAEVVPAIRALDVATLDVYINSPGGDVYDGIAIRNALRQHSAQIVTHVDGLAASAASFIAVAGDEVVMGENAELMVHDAWTIALGNATDLRQIADELDGISDNIAAMYAAKAGGDPAAWRDVMKAETWYSAQEAVDAGLADRTHGDEPAAAASFDLSMYAHAGRQAAPAPIPVAAMARPATQAQPKENTVNREQLAAALAAGTITQAQHDAALATLNIVAPAATSIDELGQVAVTALAAAQGAPGEPVAREYAAGPQATVQPTATVIDRPRSRAQIIDELVPLAQAGDVAGIVRTVNDAITDVVPADDAGAGFLPSERIGEVWTAAVTGRPTIDSLGAIKPLTSTKIEGWRWKTTSAPAAYAGELAEVPTGSWETEAVSETPSRWANANRIDRIYADLGSANLISSLFEILDRKYQGVSDAAVFTDVNAAATALTGGATTLLSAISKTYLQLKKIGAAPSKFWMAEDVFTEFAQLKVSDLPAWIANATGFVKLDGETSLAGVFDVDVNFNLAAGGFLAYDNRGATVYESPTVKLEAQVISNGGMDIGWFAYGGTLINDARAIVKTTITAA